MSLIHPYMLLPEVSGMVLQAKRTEDGGLDLHILKASAPVLALLAENGLSDPFGKPLSEHSGADETMANEWAEFVLRVLYMPYINMPLYEDSEEISGSMLQYCHMIDDWLYVNIYCRKTDEQVILSFARLHEIDDPTGLWQMMLLEQHKLMLEYTAAYGQWTVDTVSKTVYLSSKTAEQLGFGARPMIVPLRRFLSIVHPDDLQQVIDTMNSGKREILFAENRIVLADGAIVQITSSMDPVYDEEGKLLRIIGVSVKTSNRMAAPVSPSHSVPQFSRILENSRAFYMVLSASGEIKYISPGTANRLQTNADSVVGKGLEVLALPQSGMVQNEAIAGIQSMLAKSAPGRIECPLRSEGGELRWLSLKAFHVHNGHDTETLVMGEDITEEKARINRLTFLNTHDSLTRLFNRNHMINALYTLHRENLMDYCLVLLDINGLRWINDVFGYDRGDQVLLEAADIVREVFHEEKIIARTGASEFGVIVRHKCMREIEALCARLDEYSAQTQSRMLPISISWGVGCYNREQMEAQDVYRHAERNMYSHKMIAGQSVHNYSVQSLKEALRARDLETADHIERLEKTVSLLFEGLQLSAPEQARLLLLASTHDIGKIGIPDHIMKKPGPLDDEEWEIMQSHSRLGYRIAMATQELPDIAKEILCHHERWDGRGYPLGLREAEIPLLSRIITVADSYDVMTHKRIYKKAISHEEAVQELKKCAGQQFDPQVVDVFLEALNQPSAEAF